MTTARDFARGVNSNYVDVGEIMAFESGELSGEKTINMFQRLINSGAAWELQGFYGRMAFSLIKAGFCIPADLKGERRE